LFTDSKVALREAVCRPSERLSPSELEESQRDVMREVKRMQRAARNVDLQQTYRPQERNKTQDRGMSYDR
jgi:hypothetical protein